MISSVTALAGMFDRTSGVTEVRGAAPAAAAAAGGATGASFADIMGQMASSGIESVKAAEAASISGIQGKVGVQKVVEAVLTAEQNVQIVLALREKLVSAYQEVARSTI